MNPKLLLIIAVTCGLLGAASVPALLGSFTSASAGEPTKVPSAINQTPVASKQDLLLAQNQTAPPAPLASAPLKFERALKGYGANSLAFSPDGQTLATARGILSLWNVKTGKLADKSLSSKLPVGFAKFSPTAPLLALLIREQEGEGQGELVLWNLDTQQTVRTLKNPVPGNVDWHDYTFSPNGKLLATAQGAYNGTNNLLKLWNVETGEETKMLSDLPVYTLAFSPNGKLLAAGSKDFVRLWDVESGKLVHEFDAPGRLNTVTFSPDGKILASVDPGEKIFEGSIRLWNVDSGQLLHSIKPEGYDPQSVLFVPDGQTVIVGGGNLPNQDETGKLLDKESSVINFYAVADGELKSSLKLEGGPVDEMALSPDGKTLATSEYGVGGGTTAVKLWQLG